MRFMDDIGKIVHLDSAEALIKKHPTHMIDAGAAIDGFQKLSNSAISTPGNHSEAFALVQKPYHDAASKLEKVADMTKKGWVAKDGVDAKAFEEAKKAYEETGTKLEGFLSGKEKVKIAGGAEVEVEKELKEAFTKATSAVDKVKSVTNHAFGMVKLEGAGFTAKHNLNKFNVFSKDARVVTSNKDLLFRGGSMGVGAVMTIDALARGKDKEGEPRGGYTRLLEGLAGLGLVSGALLVGHAR